MGMYKQDPNNSKKQIPNIQGENRHDRAINPKQMIFHKSPNYVLVNKTLTTPCGFFFGSSGSFSAAYTSQGQTHLGGLPTGSLSASNEYMIMGDDLPVGTKLDIHPTAWSGSSADAGKITFVYKSGLSTGGF
jgi:hypothetical protein